ncbi:uncharacterized protein RAG0_02106 [Rhynchosporium agropyri]|uniref:RING-type E3 ubiquitin transferase n=1 Tax=Rhynchosporium agropyri TaxID=914238 RepID=A0A1E1K0U0_9HELO|nr:uncharacterized protein RAG0_02106 [Rhynchosporium agropyri]
MAPRVSPVSTSTSSSALDERPLPPLPTSDEDDQAGESGGIKQKDYDGRKVRSKPQISDGSSSRVASRSASTSGDIETSPTGPARTPAIEFYPEAGMQLVDEGTTSTTANAQRISSAGVATHEGSSFAAEVDAIFSSQMPSYSQESPRVHHADQASAPPQSFLRSVNSSGSDSAGDSGLQGQIAVRTRNTQQDLDNAANTEQAPYTVPKWQSDATVTLCPICRTQFSFFVRKHHCRKCGRVVCGSCSPHRITIPHQYIVQPPATQQVSPTHSTRPRLNSGRTGSSNMVENLGGGERVRLCNPCVPDPNIAPPQVPESRNLPSRPTQQGHSRSVSSTVNSTYTRSSVHNPSASSATYAQRRTRDATRMVSYNTSSSYTERNNRIRPVDLQNRSRSSTVGTNPSLSNVGDSTTTPGQWTETPGRCEQPHAPSHRPSPAPRSVIKEEDECWICHKELASRSLIDWENKRAEHVNNCLSLAMQGPPTSSSPSASTNPAPAPTLTILSQPSRTIPSMGQVTGSRRTRAPSTSTPTPTPAPPTANTAEARLAARESAHAAVVYASSSGTSPARRTGVFPYTATEKDCVDDAECTICLEEFEVGQQMGRLECFDRFHLKCIRKWFETRPGQCPVHQHGAGY